MNPIYLLLNLILLGSLLFSQPLITSLLSFCGARHHRVSFESILVAGMDYDLLCSHLDSSMYCALTCVVVRT